MFQLFHFAITAEASCDSKDIPVSNVSLLSYNMIMTTRASGPLYRQINKDKENRR